VGRRVGSVVGAPCRRTVDKVACRGTIEVVGDGHAANGARVQMLGCTTCWTTLRPTRTPLVDVPLPLDLDFADAPGRGRRG
jgi:hypothetical protein